MTKFIWLICFTTLLFLSCKTATILQEPQNRTSQKVTIGNIGLDKSFMLQKEFNGVAIPNYKNPIKLSALVLPFTKQKYKMFVTAKALQSSNVNINYIDSVKVKPTFIQLLIADKVNVISALNSKENSDVKRYLENNSSSNIISNISIAFNKAQSQLIQQASAIFLVETSPKNYALQLYKEGIKTERIQFNDGIVFQYNTSNCCWKENERHQVDIVDLVSRFNNCPKKTYRVANKAIKEDKLF